ncbi:methyltransferase [Arthrobacter sp. AOP36-A1-22]|uniref:methyltransferase n=1 Tax=Arthrobacter sp. AOP36-A1-22 TaxID=3457684 RepID=UPI004033F312
MKDQPTPEPSDLGHPAPRLLSWDDDGTPRSARWYGTGPVPTRIQVVDDTLKAEDAYRLATRGTTMLWSGDYHNARQLLSALGRRIPGARPAKRSAGQKAEPGPDVGSDFYRHRQARSRRSRLLVSILVPLAPGPAVDLRRAPDIAQAWTHAHGRLPEAAVVPLQDLLGVLGADQWRIRGVSVPALQDTIHPHYGTFAPVRGEYLDLVAEQPLPETTTAFDIGTGTGVIAAILARRGINHVIATDLSDRAIACAGENLARLGAGDIVELEQTDMFPAGRRAGLVVCNPPWLPGSANTLLDQAVYDPKSRMLRAFLTGLLAHLEPGGEGWLVISDLAEQLGLRSRDELLGWIADAGLRVAGRRDVKPTHRRAVDPDDPFHSARSAEITSLWRLTPA